MSLGGQKIRSRRVYADSCENENNESYCHIDSLHRTLCEMATKLVDKMSDQPPPPQCTRNNAYKTENVMEKLHPFNHKIKLCKKADDQEKDERVGESQRKPLEDIALARRGTMVGICRQGIVWFLSDEPYPKKDKHNRANELYGRTVIINEVFNK